MRESRGKSANLAHEGTTEVFMSTVRALHEAVPGPCRVVRVGLAGAEVVLDLVGDPGYPVAHEPTSVSSQLRTSAHASPSERRGPQNVGAIASQAL